MVQSESTTCREVDAPGPRLPPQRRVTPQTVLCQIHRRWEGGDHVGNRSRARTGTGPFFGELSHLATHTLAEKTDLLPLPPGP